MLTHLYRSNGVSQTELAETLEIEKPTLGRLLDRLEAKGWVRREHDASTAGLKRVHLTAEVEPALQAPCAEIAAELRRDALTGISAAERERFVDTLLAIKENLRGWKTARRNGSRQADARLQHARLSRRRFLRLVLLAFVPRSPC